MDDDDGNSGGGTTTGGGGGSDNSVFVGCNLYNIRYCYDSQMEYNYDHKSCHNPVCNYYGCVKGIRKGLAVCGEHAKLLEKGKISDQYPSQNPEGTILLTECSKLRIRFYSECGKVRLDEYVSNIPGNATFRTHSFFRKNGKVDWIRCCEHWSDGRRCPVCSLCEHGVIHPDRMCEICCRHEYKCIKCLSGVKMRNFREKEHADYCSGCYNQLYNPNAHLRCERLFDVSLKTCDSVLPNGDSLSTYILPRLQINTSKDESYVGDRIISDHLMRYPHGSGLDWDGETNERDHVDGAYNTEIQHHRDKIKIKKLQERSTSDIIQMEIGVGKRYGESVQQETMTDNIIQFLIACITKADERKTSRGRKIKIFVDYQNETNRHILKAKDSNWFDGGVWVVDNHELMNLVNTIFP